MAATKVQRWLDVITYLVGRRLPVSVDELMRAVPAYAERWKSGDETDRQTARRTFERDKDELRSMGIPLRTVRFSTSFSGEELEGYIIERRDFYLPYLELISLQQQPKEHYSDRHRPDTVEIERDDAPLALEALRRVADLPGFSLAEDARSAFRKLAFDIDPDLFPQKSSAVLFAEKPGTAELSANLRVLSDALLARKTVTFRYHGIYRGTETNRRVDGYGVLLQHGHWYLVGHDHDRDDVRVYRVGRMQDVEANRKSPNRHDYAIPPDFRLDVYVGREAWELGEPEDKPVTAHVLFGFPRSLWAERNGHGSLLQRHDDGSETRAFDVHQVAPFLRWLLSLDGDAQLLEPAELVDELQALAKGIAAAHAEDDDAR